MGSASTESITSDALSTPNSWAMTASFSSRTCRTRCSTVSLQDEVDCPHNMWLPDSVHSANSLLDAHRIPWHIEVDDDMAELEVQPFAASIGRNQDTRIAGERLLSLCASVKIHAAIECDD